MSLFVFFISLLIVAQHVSGNHVPFIRSWRLRDVIASCWYVHGRTTFQPDLTTFPQPRHIPTQGYNITQSSAPDDGHMVARNMLSNYQKRNNEYKKWQLVGFLIHIELRCTVNRTQILQYLIWIHTNSEYATLSWNNWTTNHITV